MVARLGARAERYNYADPQLPGHYVRVFPTGAKSFAVTTRDPRGKQVWHTIGGTTLHSIADAREFAREAIKAIKAGADRAGPQSFQSVAENWLKRHVDAKGLRTQRDIRRNLGKHILPAWGGREFNSITRGDVAKLLDGIEDKSGPVAADKVLALITKLCRWYATRHSNYVTPIVPGMRRSDPKARARVRILSDDEIRALWEVNGAFGAYVKLLLLTAQRREKVAAMRWQDVSVDGVWSVPNGEREKGTGGDLQLPEPALDIIRARPRFASNPYVFAGRGDSHFSGYSKAKAALDASVPLPQWGLHDLRRTARSLMSRAGVRPDIAERVLGHAIGGVEGVYDRHSYREEKAEALKRLAALLGTIINPPDNVTVSRVA
jgi:integrase